jgi:hypothetical protein
MHAPLDSQTCRDNGVGDDSVVSSSGGGGGGDGIHVRSKDVDGTPLHRG